MSQLAEETEGGGADPGDRSHEGVLDTITESKKFEEGTEKDLEAAYDSFLDQFETSDGQSIKPGTQAKVDPTEDDELEQEQIVKQKKGQ